MLGKAGRKVCAGEEAREGRGGRNRNMRSGEGKDELNGSLLFALLISQN